MMIAREPIAQLQDALTRTSAPAARSGEIVRWLRSVAPSLANAYAPPTADRARGYSRSLIHKAGAFEIVLIHWQPQCRTDVHDHGGALCWFAVAGGEMQVENYLRYDSGEQPGHARIGLEGREQLLPGGIDYRQDDVHLHRCLTADLPATTLHVYAHPIERYHTFDETAQTCAAVTSTYDAVL